MLIGAGARSFGDLDSDVLLTLVGTHATAGGMVHVTSASSAEPLRDASSRVAGRAPLHEADFVPAETDVRSRNMSDQTTPMGDDTPLDELSDTGAGLGAGDANTFEPEEEPDTN